MSEPMADYEVAILGAGAAGLMAAIRAAELGRSVVLLEKNRRPGVKILMSGGTRCNLTNARGLRNLRVVSGPVDPAYDSRQALGARSIQAGFGANGAFLGPSLKAFSVESTVEFFEKEGVATKVEGNGKIFPASDRAVDVLAAIVARLERTSAKLLVNCACQGVKYEDGRFVVSKPDGSITANKVILAVGGLSYPGCGTTGDGYGIARSFGHSLVETRPALVPLRVDAEWVKALAGLTLPDTTARVVDSNGITLIERREAVLFAHFGLTGPAILDVSRAVARHNSKDQLRLMLDLVPERRAEELETALQQVSRSGRGQVVGMLPGQLPRRLADAVMASAGVPPTRIGAELSREERRRVVGTLKGLTLPIAGTLGFGKAEVTSGGVELGEVRAETLESLRAPGLYFAGEVLDLDGLIGGYNFQAAWSTGWLAGQSRP